MISWTVKYLSLYNFNWCSLVLPKRGLKKKILHIKIVLNIFLFLIGPMLKLNWSLKTTKLQNGYINNIIQSFTTSETEGIKTYGIKKHAEEQDQTKFEKERGKYKHFKLWVWRELHNHTYNKVKLNSYFYVALGLVIGKKL